MEKLALWTIRARQWGWLDGDEAVAAADLKMLWCLSGRIGSASEEAAPDDIVDDLKRSVTALPASSSYPAMLPPLPSQDDVFRMCLAAAAGDGRRVISEAEAIHCRCDNVYKITRYDNSNLDPQPSIP